jgi:hypothetical protein
MKKLPHGAYKGGGVGVPISGFRFRAGAESTPLWTEAGGPGREFQPDFPWPIVYQMFTIYPMIEIFWGQFHYNAHTPISIVIHAKCDCACLS